MKFLKVLGIIILGLVAIFFIGALFAPREMTVEREVVVNKPIGFVFEYVKHLKNQDQYGKWFKADPKMKKEYLGTDGTVGFTSKWESKSQGAGEQEIKNIEEGKRVDFELRFLKPFKATNQAFMTTEVMSEGQTKVKWGFTSHSSYPWNFISVLMKGSLQKDFQTGLNNLKANIEN